MFTSKIKELLYSVLGFLDVEVSDIVTVTIYGQAPVKSNMVGCRKALQAAKEWFGRECIERSVVIGPTGYDTAIIRHYNEDGTFTELNQITIFGSMKRDKVNNDSESDREFGVRLDANDNYHFIPELGGEEIQIEDL